MTTTEAGSEALTLMSYLEPRGRPLAYAFLGALLLGAVAGHDVFVSVSPEPIAQD